MSETPDRYCGNCGRELSPEDQFCRNCGRPVHQAARVPTPEADVPVPPPLQAGSVRNGSGGNGGGGGEVAEKPKQERQAAQQEQSQKNEPQPEKVDQAQGGQQEQQQGGGQQPEPQKPEPQKPSFANFGAGTYQVGADIQPGTYRTRVGSPNCYWERLKNFRGGINGILANGGTSAPGIVTIEPTDVGFHSEGCGTWTKDLSAITTSKTSFGAGAYIVGTDIEPGTYRNSGGNNCYYERLRGFNGGMNAIIANGGSNHPSIVTIAPTDAGFQSQGCGTWTKLE
jgi:zinc-ribbon domain